MMGRTTTTMAITAVRKTRPGTIPVIWNATAMRIERNGPSTLRITRTTLAGWRRYKNHPDKRIRARFAWEARELATTFTAVPIESAMPWSFR